MTIEWKTVKRKVNNLMPLSINPRKISEYKKEQLIASLEKFNLAEIPAINQDDSIISGHQRMTALQMLNRGEEFIDVRIPNRMLTLEEVKEYNLISNTHSGEWDFAMLEEHFGDFELEEIGITWPADVDLEPLKIKGEDNYEIPEEVNAIVTDIKLEDVFEFQNGKLGHRLICGDATVPEHLNRLFGDEKCDMVLTDPPYNVDYTGKTKDKLKIINDKKSESEFQSFLSAFYKNLYAHCKEGGAWYVWHSSSEIVAFASAFIECGLLLKQQLIWMKNNFVMGRQDYQWKHEPCLYGWKPGAAHKWMSDRKQTTILEFDKPKRNGAHPTMKPIPLLEYQICNSSERGDIIADTFLGSGSSMVASHKNMRSCYGIEMDPKYCQVIINRMLTLDPDLTIKRNGLDVTQKYRNELRT